MSVAYRTNTAYDYRTYDERYEAERPAAAPRAVRRSKVMFRRAVMIVTAIAVAAVCIGLLYLKAEVYMAQRNINATLKSIAVAESLNGNLSEQYSEASDINKIMTRATALGMGYATSDQVLYVDLSGNKTNVQMKK